MTLFAHSPPPSPFLAPPDLKLFLLTNSLENFYSARVNILFNYLGQVEGFENCWIAELEVHLCVSEQTIYTKAIELKGKNQEKFNSYVLMMDMLHILMMFKPILSKRFADAGVRDVHT